MRAWLRQHRRALTAALRKLAAQKSAGLLSASVIGIALALPTGGYVLLDGLRTITGRASLDPHISVFLRTDAKRVDVDALGQRLRGDTRVAAVRFVSRDEALKELGAAEGLADVVAALERNPLPDTFVLRSRNASPEALDTIAAELRRLPAVAHVQVDALWARRLAALADLVRLALAMLAGLLAFGLVAVTFNTIRLQILTLRDEVLVSKLIGASDAFVQRPFYYLGMLQGLAGGIVAVLVVWTGVAILNSQVAALAESYGSSFSFGFLSWGDTAGVIFLAGGLGWLGAYLCVSKYLREIG
jgi:cell division transport system permease protein